jgi:ankyrin repeat protein
MVPSNVESQAPWSPSMSSIQRSLTQVLGGSSTNYPSPLSPPIEVRQPTIGMRAVPQTLSPDLQLSMYNGMKRSAHINQSATEMGNSHIFQPRRHETNIVQNFDQAQIFPLSPETSYEELNAPLPHRHTSLLHLAVASGNADTLRLLLQNLDISTDSKDAFGYTALERAVLQGRTDLVAILLDHARSDDEAFVLSTAVMSNKS